MRFLFQSALESFRRSSHKAVFSFMIVAVGLAAPLFAQTNNAFSFNGTSQYVTFGIANSGNSNLGANAWTIECWFNRSGAGVSNSTGTGGVSMEPLVCKGRNESDGSNVDMNYGLGVTVVSGNAKLCADFEEGISSPAGTLGLNHPVTGATTITTGVWHHAAATYDGHVIRVYLDGVLDGSVTVAAVNTINPRGDSIQHASVGSALNSTGAAAGFFKGTIDETRIWNVARSQGQISGVMNFQLQGFVFGLLGRYGFNEASGATTASSFGVGPAGTLMPVATPPSRVAGFPNFTSDVVPVVSITAPANNATVMSGSNVTVSAAASDSDGSVLKVDFLDGATLIGSATAAPYSATWNNVAAGDHTISAVATDNVGATTTSAVTVHVVANQLPTVTLTAPLDGDSSVGPATINLAATAGDADGTVAKVEFYSGATKVGEALAAPYTFAWANVPVGDYALTAKAIDDLGASTTSATVAYHVIVSPTNALPTVSLTAPSDGSSYIVPASVGLTASASDSDGTVAKVEFFNGATKIGEALAAPYSFTWTNVPVGDYSVTAKATDDLGGTSTSAPITLHVTPNQPPTFTVNAPADNAVGIGNSTTLNLSVADPEGQAMTVTFYGRHAAPVTPGPNFTLIAIPDTQYYSSSLHNATPAIFHAQTQWIVDNRDARNIVFVSHMGDIAQNGDSFESEWIAADAAMQRIENPASTLRGFGIPWGGAPGNHDQSPIGDAGGTTNFYNQYFSYTRWADRPYFAGHFGTKNNNNYELFSASGLDFIVLHLEYDVRAQSFYQPVLDWADALLKAYPHRRAIVTSHWIVNTGNPATFSAQGQAIYDALKNNPNLFLMLCGHVNGEGQRADTFAGRTVYSLLQDYQETTNGGNGFLRIFTFSPASNKITVESYSPTLNRAVNASDSIPGFTGAFDLPYNMQSPVTDWIPLGSVNVPAGGTTAALSWTGLDPSSDFEWYAVVSDGPNAVNTQARHFSTAASVAPSVTLDSPATGASYARSSVVPLAVTASDSDGSIAKVMFFDGSKKLGESLAAPFAYSWSGGAVGSHSVTAVAVDDSGVSRVSNIATVTITNQAPTVALTGPVDDALYDAPAGIHITATAGDADGAVAKVEFYQGVTKIGESTAAPYAFDWTGVFTGVYTLTVKAIDNDGAVTTSDPIDVFVNNLNNQLPTVTLTAPADGAHVAAGGTVTLAATASDSDGTVAKVEFFRGATKLGEDLTAPYSFDWTNVPSGSSALTAVATDNDGGTTTTSTVTLIGDVAPPASLSFSENFNSMGASGTAPPSGWSVKNGNSGTTNATWVSSIPGMGTNSVASMVAAAGALTASTAPTTTNNNGFNASVPATPADRVLTTSPTSVSGAALQWQLTNTSGSPLTTLKLSYDIRRFTSVTTDNELPGYWVFYSLDNGTTWTNVAPLNPTLAGPTGIVVPNTVGVTSVPQTTIALNGTWQAGATLLLRWVDDNAVQTSPDQIIGLDNVALTATGGAVGVTPTVSLTAPAANAVYSAPALVSFAATSGDADGTVTKVEFYQGATKVGEDTTSPYTFDWTNVAAGSYSLTAVATDNDGNTATSAPIAITVNPAPGSGTLTRGPYLQKAAPTQITVRWRSSQAVAGRVRYGSDPSNLDHAVDEGGATTEHIVPLTGLSAATTYFYSVGSAFDTLASDGDCTFTTPPVSGTVIPTRIWVLGDAGTASSSQKAVRDAFYAWTGTRTPNLVLQLGDNAYNSGLDTEFQSAVFNIYTTMLKKTPFWSCLGNHETAQATAFVDTYPYFNIYTFPTAGECGGVSSGTEHYYSFDYANIHFISLDSMTADRSTTGPMATWLQTDLASTTATWVICFFHHPPYTKGSHNSDTESELIQMRQNFLPILEAGGVDLVLSGHSHSYERSFLLDGHYGLSTTFVEAMKVNGGDGRPSGNGAYIKPLTGPRDHFGAVYSVAGSAGQISGGTLNHPAHYISLNNLGSLVLDVNGTRLDGTFIRENSTTPDTFTMIKQGGADSDGDGMSDEYEIANGLDRHNAADAAGDLDGDGMSNLFEYALGTPANSAVRSGLPVLGQGAGSDAGKLTLTFNRARAEFTYTVQATDDLKTWVDIATNAGTIGSPATVVDTNTTSPNRYLRLKVTDGIRTFATIPQGRITYSLTNNQETAVSFPLETTIGSVTGQSAGFITAVGSATIDNANAGWTAGQLSQPSAPYLLRITRGAAAGRMFPISTSGANQNTSTRATLSTGGVDLTTLGIVPSADTYELVTADTLSTLFPAGTLQAGTVGTADTLRLWNGSVWLTYFFDGVHWQRQGAGLADDTLVRPDQGWMLLRRGPTTSLVLYGAVSSTDAKVLVQHGGSSYVSLLPIPQTFSEFSLQNLLPGWTSNPANPTAGDYVRLWNGSVWLSYYYDGTKWMRQGAGDASSTTLLKPGRPIYIVRPSAAGSDILMHLKTY